MPLRARRTVGLYFLAVATALLSPAWAGARSSHSQRSHTRFSPKYAFRDATFTGLVTDSYRQTSQGTAGAAEFYRWLDAAYLKTRRTVGPPPGVSRALPLAGALDAERYRLARVSGSAAKIRQEREVAAWTHRTVKKAIPRFSLERGFEFYSMVHGGERQCYSQSVLIAGMLQRVGIPAGVVMVWKSEAGATSNNGHAVTIAQLSNGHHLLVDASEPLPFPRQQGLFVRQDRQYRYVTPVFPERGLEIVGYRRQADQGRINVSSVQALDLPFLKSQFYYYRGERAPGGAFDSKKTVAGLTRSAQHLQNAVRLCPENPLATYMLGRVYQRLGKIEAARQQFTQAFRQYNSFGYVPNGTRDVLALVEKTPRDSRAEPGAVTASHRSGTASPNRRVTGQFP